MSPKRSGSFGLPGLRICLVSPSLRVWTLVADEYNFVVVALLIVAVVGAVEDIIGLNAFADDRANKKLRKIFMVMNY